MLAISLLVLSVFASGAAAEMTPPVVMSSGLTVPSAWSATMSVEQNYISNGMGLASHRIHCELNVSCRSAAVFLPLSLM